MTASSAGVAPSANRNTTAGTTPSQSGSFEQQLSSAIADSLKKLGVTQGELNISIKNSEGSATPQIVISYSPSGRVEKTETPSARQGGTTRSNPFSGPDLPSLPTEPQPVTPATTPWAPWAGPVDHRDSIPAGAGQTTASGSPRIQLSETPAANQYNYAGPAAKNPYFTTPSNPLRDGYVLGFQNWFSQAFILGADSGPVPANKTAYSTEEGAQEALRVVQQFEPEAKIDQGPWGGGPFVSSKQMYYISLPGGRLLSAGAILANYYNGGQGVTTESDAMLERTLRMA